MPHKGARCGAPGLCAGEGGEGWRLAFSWCSAVPGRGSSSERRRQRGSHSRPSAAWSRVGGALHKAGVGRGRARPTRQRDPHCRSAPLRATFPAPNPNKHENGWGRPASRPFVLASHGTAAAGIPPRFCVSSPAAPVAFPTSAAWKAGSLPGLSPWALGRTKGGSAPNLGEGED